MSRAVRPSAESALLLAAARSGDRAALGELVDGIRPYLKAVAARLLGRRLSGKLEAEDVVQQACVAALERFSQFRGSSLAEWQGWMITIVKNEARSQMRYWHQDRRDVQQERPLAPQHVAGGTAPHTDGLPGDIARRREQAAALLAALERLPPDHRQVIQLRNLDGLPYADIARHMDRSEQAVRQLWVRALKRLRDQVGMSK